jgi:predicted alpha/beta-fold hydrolase
MDDPVVTSEVIPWQEIKSNPNVILATTKFGGHIGWFKGGNLFPKERWFPTPVREFIHAIVDVMNINQGPYFCCTGCKTYFRIQ